MFAGSFFDRVFLWEVVARRSEEEGREEEGDNNRALMDPAVWDGDEGGRHNAEEEVSSFLLFVRSVGRPRIIKASPPSHKHTGRQPLPFSHLLMPRDSQKISSSFERGGGGGGETDGQKSSELIVSCIVRRRRKSL